MLSQAHLKAEKESRKDILFLCQDMRSFELYGTVDACVLLPRRHQSFAGQAGASPLLPLGGLYLNPDGLFVFDMNGPYKFKNTFSSHAFVYDYGDLFARGKRLRPAVRALRLRPDLFQAGGRGVPPFRRTVSGTVLRTRGNPDLLTRAGLTPLGSTII
jgi:hypothetical protein